MPSIFRKLAPQDLHAHLRYFASTDSKSHRAEILLGPPPVEFPVLLFRYRRLPNRIGLLIRSSSVGRGAMDKLFDHLQSEGGDFKIRRSAKLRLVSQITLRWPIADGLYPAAVVAALRKVWDILGRQWPPTIEFIYPLAHVRESLPGTLEHGLGWKVGYALGRVAGRVVGDN